MARQPKKVLDQAVTDAPFAAPSSSRFAAGEDPVKRGQILDGAKRVFLKMGFDAASMNDVTREAGVSKGTIYVYFENKEDLFAALIEREKGRFAETLRDLLADSQDLEDGLRRFGLAFNRQILTGDMIPAMRTVLGVVDRMPGLCSRFMSGAPANARSVLEEFLRQKTACGAIKPVDEVIAARQFIELSTGTYFKLKLFNELHSLPDQEEVDRVVDSAIYVFMSAYGPDRKS